VQLAADYYRDQLGFTYGRIWGDPPCFCIASRDGLELMLSQVPEGEPVDAPWRESEGVWNAYFWVNDAQAVYAELLSRGANLVSEPCEQPYGCLEFTVMDRDGHSIGIGQNLT
jgi:uncharacterized glyoxalase superfamily protein PhnB